MLSLTVDFYIRLFIRVKESPSGCHQNLLKYASVFQCMSCESFYLQPLGRISENKKGPAKVATPRVVVPASCNACEGDFTIGGPIWQVPMHDIDFVERLLEAVNSKELELGTRKRIQGLLKGIIDEKPVADNALCYDMVKMAKSIRIHNPSKKEFLFGLSQLGYTAVQTYYSAEMWKTNAPPEALYKVLASFKNHTYKYDKEKIFQNVSKTQAGFKILEKNLENKLDFDIKKAKEELKEGDEDELSRMLRSSKKAQKKYFVNPEPGWGPKSRAGS